MNSLNSVWTKRPDQTTLVALCISNRCSVCVRQTPNRCAVSCSCTFFWRAREVPHVRRMGLRVGLCRFGDLECLASHARVMMPQNLHFDESLQSAAVKLSNCRISQRSANSPRSSAMIATSATVTQIVANHSLVSCNNIHYHQTST